MKNTKKFVYHERTADDVRARAEQSGGGYDSIIADGVDVFRPKEGDNLVRFFPPTWGRHNHFGYDIYVHRYIGPGSGTYLCLNTQNNGKWPPAELEVPKGPCPICRAWQRAKEEGEPDEDVRKLAPTKQVVAWILDREDSAVPKVYVMGWMLDRDLGAACTSTKTGKVLLIDHPDNGYDVVVKRHGTGKTSTKYQPLVEREESPISESDRIQQELLEYVEERPIPTVLRFRSAKYLEQVISGTVEKEEDVRARGNGSDNSDEEEEAPPPRVRTRQPNAQEPEEEDEPPRTSTKPSSSKPSMKPRSKVKDEDEEEDEEEDAPPPPPKKSRPPVDEDEEEEAPRRPGRR